MNYLEEIITMERYLLYIDILGFADHVKKDYALIRALFDRIDNLNVHRHGEFQTIVFSDTILIFSKSAALNRHDHEYLVMYACEFVQDLMIRCLDLEIQFRAVLTYDDFYYEKKNYIEAYHGKALVNAYYKEKEINAMGLFIDSMVLQYNTIFKTMQFDKNLHFVYLLQNIERLYFYGAEAIPIDSSFVENSLEFPYLKEEVKILEILKLNIDTQLDSKIRGKYVQTYYLYQQRYGELISIFEKGGFDYKIVSPNADWNVYD